MCILGGFAKGLVVSGAAACTLDYSDLMGLFAVRLWLSQANWPNYVALRQAVMPKQSAIWLVHPGMLVYLLQLVCQNA